MKKILIFTGAGFGVPIGLPTTTEFRPTIDKWCKGDFKNALQGYLGAKFYDIESILSTLEFFVHNKSFLKHLLDRVISSQQFFHEFNTVRNQNMVQKQNALSLIFELKKSLFDILGKYNKNQASALYRNMVIQIKEAYGSSSALSIFTTNYDLTFEHSQDELETIFADNGIKDIGYGFSIKNQIFYFDYKKQYSWSNSVIEYKKLHGSLDWVESNGKIIKAGGIIEPSNPDKMLLLYPGYKGTPNDEPYKSIHDDLLQRLLTADVVYVIGFAFRDDYINNQFDTALKINKDIKVFCYNPCAIEELPSESKLGFFANKYKDKFMHIKNGISIEDKNEPLRGVKKHGQNLIYTKAMNKMVDFIEKNYV